MKTKEKLIEIYLKNGGVHSRIDDVDYCDDIVETIEAEVDYRSYPNEINAELSIKYRYNDYKVIEQISINILDFMIFLYNQRCS